MASRKAKKPDLYEKLSIVTYKMINNEIDNLTYTQTLEAIFEGSDEALNPKSYVHSLKNYRRLQLEELDKQAKRLARVNRKIKMIETNFPEVN